MMAKKEPKTTNEHLINIYNKIDTLENNHIPHLEKEVKKLNYVLWAIGFMVATQFIAFVLQRF
jgi:hypothetical protein|tara:strand:- start:93 stop:281 length:189 start_codon:yes stop_codon:yes gene_type:complete